MERVRRCLLEGSTEGYRGVNIEAVLGLNFVACQLLGWQTLGKRNIYLGSNAAASTYDLLTAEHGLHRVGGNAALGYICRRIRSSWPQPTREAAALCWHFIDVLWIFILGLLLFWGKRMSNRPAAATSEPRERALGTLLTVPQEELGMWLLIDSDSLMFSAPLLAQNYVQAPNNWPTPFHFHPLIIFQTVIALVPLSGGLTMVYAVSGRHSSGQDTIDQIHSWIASQVGKRLKYKNSGS